MSELKPCPFCGGSEIYAEEYEHHPGAVRWRVFCAGCMAGIDTGTRQSMGQAVQDWNRRAERTCEFFYDEKMAEYACSACGERVSWSNPADEYEVSPLAVLESFEYCPNCGARIIEEGV